MGGRHSGLKSYNPLNLKKLTIHPLSKLLLNIPEIFCAYIKLDLLILHEELNWQAYGNGMSDYTETAYNKAQILP